MLQVRDELKGAHENTESLHQDYKDAWPQGLEIRRQQKNETLRPLDTASLPPPGPLYVLKDETDVLHQSGLIAWMCHRSRGAQAAAGGLADVYILRATKCLRPAVVRWVLKIA